MKWLILLFPLNAFATVFLPNTQLPKELQARVHAMALSCGDYAHHWSLQEKQTTVRAERIDQGIVDYYYTTEFSLQYYFDGTHPISTAITVESAQYEINNPVEARWQVESVDCPQL